MDTTTNRRPHGDGDVFLRVDGGVALISIDRPKANNAMTWAMYDQLVGICDEIDTRDDVRVVILRGAGGKAFTAGTDISQFAEFASGNAGVDYENRIEVVVARVETLKVPTIAVIEGYAVGGGMTFSSVCDFRISTPDAVFGVPIARTIGNCLSMRNYARLVSLIGPARTKNLIFTARLLTAQEAAAVGFVDRIAERGELEDAIGELVAVLRAKAPLTLRVTKEAVGRLTMANLPDDQDLIELCYGSDDFREGVAAFVDKRRPEWRGR